MRTESTAIAAVVGVAVVGCLFPSLASLTGGADDASSDAGGDVATDAGIVAFCASADATFCDDFDDLNGNTFPKWDNVEAFDGGSIVRVDAGLSAPNAIAIQYAKANESNQLTEQINVALGTASHVHWVYDVIVDEYDTSGSFLLVGELDITSN